MTRRKRRVDLETSLQRIEDFLEKEDMRKARRELVLARKVSPRSHDLDEFELLILIAEDRLPEALEFTERILSEEPDCLLASRQRPSLLMELGRFPEARRCLEALIATDLPEDEEEAAELFHDLAVCLDREGKKREADDAFREAARLVPWEYSVPLRLPPREFDALVEEALASIPEEFHTYLDQVAVVVRDYPPFREDPFLLGLYLGVPRTDRTQETDDHLDTVIIFKRNHELQHRARDELREEVRKTVVHEIAHHFGLEEEEMGEYA